jgi:DNA repair protein RadA/Sms
MAVLEKRVGLQLGGCDAYVNLAGGMKLGEPAIDLGIILAISSSYKNIALPADTIIFGEVGLVGEIRGVSQAEQRIIEAEKMGFRTCILPKANLENIRIKTDIKLIGVANVREALDAL